MFPIKAGMIPFQMYSPMEISGVPTQMAMGINVILATTWSNPKETKPKSGHQIPVSFDATSQPCSPMKQATQTKALMVPILVQATVSLDRASLADRRNDLSGSIGVEHLSFKFLVATRIVRRGTLGQSSKVKSRPAPDPFVNLRAYRKSARIHIWDWYFVHMDAAFSSTNFQSHPPWLAQNTMHRIVGIILGHRQQSFRLCGPVPSRLDAKAVQSKCIQYPGAGIVCAVRSSRSDFSLLCMSYRLRKQACQFDYLDYEDLERPIRQLQLSWLFPLIRRVRRKDLRGISVPYLLFSVWITCRSLSARGTLHLVSAHAMRESQSLV